MDHTLIHRGLLWSLVYLGGTRRMERSLLVVDDVLLQGVGPSFAQHRRFHVSLHDSPELAREAAWMHTAAWEADGYSLCIEPHSFDMTDFVVCRLRDKAWGARDDREFQVVFAEARRTGVLV